MSSTPAHAAPDTSISVDGGQSGRTFDGIGAISGGGGNSRLLTDYPAAQQKQILDYMFKPGYGANLQLLKLEIGGDANSTDGSEPSIEHSKGVVNCNAGYEFWLAEQAKARNPDIGLYGLAWAAPGWINGGFWSDDTIDYLISWLGCAKQHGLPISYLGGWNERGHDADWFVKLRSALDAHGYSGIKLVADDSGWSVADDMAKDKAFNDAVSIIGTHYSCNGGDGGDAKTCQSTEAARASGKPLWDSENGSQDMNTGAPALIRAITRGYIDAKMVSFFNWPLMAAIYPNLPYDTVGLATAGSPWSGNYTIGASTWATAQVTQFTQPGWKFIDSASGYLGGDENNGSYVSLKSPNGKDYSTVLETTTATASQTANFTVAGGLSTGAVHVWATDVNAPGSATSFVHTQDITPVDGAYSLTMQPGYVYTVSTLNGAGKGTATAPAAHALKLPYSDSFDRNTAGTEAKYVSDMQGSFEVQKCAAGRHGMCLQQMAPVKPIEWQEDSDAFTLVGDPTWTNYTMQSDVELAKPGTVELIGRAGTQNRPQSHQQGYSFRISDTGAWTIVKTDAGGNRTVLTRSATTALGTGSWHRLGLSFSGDAITASVDGKDIGVVHDSTYTAGQGGLGLTSYDTDQFDNLSFTADKASSATAALAVTPATKTVQRGKTVTVTTTVSVPQHAPAAEGVNVTLVAPKGFTFDSQAQVFGAVKPGHSAVATWELTAPTDAASTATLTATATFAQNEVSQWLRQDAQVQVTNLPPPTGVNDVSDLDFVSATNGWGPVERDQSVGGQNAGDGTPLTIDGTVYPKGLGTNAVSDVDIYLGGNCSTFTTTVGNDDDAGNSGTMTFSVLGDGKVLASTKTIKGGDPAQQLTADLTGVQSLDLVVGDAGDNNAYDHGDWAAPKLTCSSP
ncbi:NPCBM/NEW2 domain-containing protein [Streptomyces sp. V4-01]|uniref:galactosylceramidase n=1 Tax=Actinacidiphila polyblastidii TaxID=3110430 RepID=A0ABU7PBF0_9ACTN|nr:NPCBM/NEW2 domain-containing protein [Streptomyces sp. V4-01]